MYIRSVIKYYLKLHKYILTSYSQVSRSNVTNKIVGLQHLNSIHPLQAYYFVYATKFSTVHIHMYAKFLIIISWKDFFFNDPINSIQNNTIFFTILIQVNYLGFIREEQLCEILK